VRGTKRGVAALQVEAGTRVEMTLVSEAAQETPCGWSMAGGVVGGPVGMLVAVWGGRRSRGEILESVTTSPLSAVAVLARRLFS